VRPRRDDAHDLLVPIDILLEPARQHAWRVGAGYSTDTGPRGSLR
jgi:outer membrane translocation and assembly module TamA